MGGRVASLAACVEKSAWLKEASAGSNSARVLRGKRQWWQRGRWGGGERDGEAGPGRLIWSRGMTGKPGKKIRWTPGARRNPRRPKFSWRRTPAAKNFRLKNSAVRYGGDNIV